MKPVMFMKTKHSALLGVVVSSALVLAACGNGDSDGSDTGSGPRVVASFYPFAYVAEQVAGTNADVQNLTSPGTEPHDLELKPRQIADVQRADLVLYQTGFQAAVDEAVDEADLSGSEKIDIADVSALKKSSDGMDPHVWLDPSNMVKITDAVVAKLSAVDKPNAATYAKNGDAFKQKLGALDESFRTGLETCKTRKIVTSHAAYAYLTDKYGLEQVAIAGIDPSNEPSAAQLAGITRLVNGDGITTVFTEELVSPKIVDTIAAETGARTATLSPIEGLSDSTKNETYLTLMEQNLEAIKKANSCS